LNDWNDWNGLNFLNPVEKHSHAHEQHFDAIFQPDSGQDFSSLSFGDFALGVDHSRRQDRDKSLVLAAHDLGLFTVPPVR
jgi:hypothetical protein